ncbi:pilus assembly protein TadG-related protein [Ramlibacter sp. AN1015]|uniref:pilus assembly protein TadG-related protein n=1 Tax=Ramlibacter sp. AN1015 TaxID=3133428 RepID=UPI0030C3705D
MTRRPCVSHGSQGAVLPTAAMLLFFLFGFMGLALDFGRMFIVRTELQTALDSCALAAAQELDAQANSITRALSAGMSAGNANPVNLQSADWAGQGQLTEASFTFYDEAYGVTTDPLAATYVECAHSHGNVRTWLLHMMGMFVRDASAFPQTRTVGGRAVATRVSAQTTCPIPVALKRAPGSSRPLYGFLVGQWVTVYGARLGGPGEFGWYNLDGSTNARSTRDQLIEGRCETRVGDELGTPGAKASVHEAWNYRFGIYRNNEDPSVNRPDFSGYAYTSLNWRNAMPQNAFEGDPAPGSHESAQNFREKRRTYGSFHDGGSIQEGSLIVFGRRNALNSFHDVATPGAAGQHGQLGANRRLALVPVIDEANRVIDYMCIFMLHPLTGPQDDAQIEVRGNAGSLNSPCTTSGLPGGSAGPLVPALVR